MSITLDEDLVIALEGLRSSLTMSAVINSMLRAYLKTIGGLA